MLKEVLFPLLNFRFLWPSARQCFMGLIPITIKYFCFFFVKPLSFLLIQKLSLCGAQCNIVFNGFESH